MAERQTRRPGTSEGRFAAYLEAIAAVFGDVIPNPADQNLCAQSRSPMDMMRHGWSTSLFQAWQQWSTMASPDGKTRFESQCRA